MQSCLSPHPSSTLEISIYQRIYLKYSYLETFPGGAPLRVTYAEPKPPSWPTACPPLPPLTFPIVAPATLSITTLPSSTNCCPTKNLMECSLLGKRARCLPFRKPAIGLLMNSWHGLRRKTGFPWEGPKQPSSSRPSPALTPVAVQHRNPTTVTSPKGPFTQKI